MNEGADAAPGLDIATDALLDGQLVLRQPRRGHRAGTDAVLLAAACSLSSGDRVVDVGCGVGTVGLALALREPAITGLLLDNDPLMIGLAEENCRRNRVDDRIAVAAADLFDDPARRRAGLEPESADVVVTNPPFFLGAETRASPEAGKARAHVLSQGSPTHGHADWLRAAATLLVPKGRFFAIHRPDALPALLAACQGRLGAVVVAPVYAKPDAPAIRIILSAIKGSRAPMSLGRALVLHGPEGRFTAEAEEIHRGKALLRL